MIGGESDERQAKGAPGIGYRDGAWELRFYGPDHRRHAERFTRLTDAKDRQREVAVDKRRGERWVDPARGRIALDGFYARWQEQAIRNGEPTERTRVAYGEIWRRYVSPALGGRPLTTITREDAQSVVDSAPSRWRAHDTRKVLSRILAAAVRDERI